MTTYDVLIVGAGIFGVTAALELKKRGSSVALIDPGPLPHPLAASTDISKVVRSAYGSDAFYTELGEQAIQGWYRWNEELSPLYHETGVTMFSSAPMAPGEFEYESYHLLKQRGHTIERLNADEIARRFPAWKTGGYVDGFYHPQSGWAESGRTVEVLVECANREGAALFPGQTFASFIEHGGRVHGVKTREGETFYAGHVLLATGSWTPALLPELAPYLRATGHPVFHLAAPDPARFTPPDFAVFCADISRTGWYGFPHHPHANVVKIANHGIGQQLHPEHDERVVTPDDETNLRRMLANTFPDLVNAPIVYTRRCLYSDSFDGDFWIDRHPEREGLTVAAGDSGHAFKFAPVLGAIIADAVECKANKWLSRFRWRDLSLPNASGEASRYQG